MIKAKITTITLNLVLLIFILCSCAQTNQQPISNNSSPVENSVAEESREMTSEEKQAQKDFANSTPENDTDTGLKSIKIDTAEMDLSDAQKKIIQYFDDDYLEVEEYEFLHRYPNLFTGVQVRVYGEVSKIIGMNALP